MNNYFIFYNESEQRPRNFAQPATVKGGHMGMRRFPREVHVVHGTLGDARSAGVALPEQVKARIPFAEWANDPKAFTRERFVKDTADYLFQVYGIGSEQDQHALLMLADQMQTYVSARAQLQGQPLVIETNNGATVGANPLLAVQDRAMVHALRLMTELGLTPKSRLTASKVDEVSPYAEILKGYTRA